MQIGDIIPTTTSTPPDFGLWCDGSEVAQADYPLLYAIIGDTFGSASGGNFKLPDMRGAFPLGTGDRNGLDTSLGDTGGEAEHTLSESEMPSHTHTEGIAIPAVINGGLEAPAAAATPSTGVTGSAGLGQAHNNVPPYLALNYYIVAR